MWVSFLWLACGAPPEPPSVFVVVAARDLNVGVPIGEEDVIGVKMDIRYVPDDVFLDPTVVVGRVPSSRILSNELIRGRRLADGELQRMVEGLVPRDKQVRTVALDEAVAVEPEAGSLVEVWQVNGAERTRLLEQVSFLRIDGRLVALTLTDPQAATLVAAGADARLVVVPATAAGMNFQPAVP